MQSYLFVFDLAKFGAFFALFGPFEAFFWVRVRFKTFFVTYLCKQSTLVLEVQSYLFLFLLVTFGASLALFWPFRAILFGTLGLSMGLGSCSKTLLEPNYVDNQLWFWKYSPIFLFLIWPHLGPLALFWALWGYFLVLLGYFWSRGQVQKHFWNLLM